MVIFLLPFDYRFTWLVALMMFLQRLNFRAYCVVKLPLIFVSMIPIGSCNLLYFAPQVVHSAGRKHIKQEGYSYPLCCRILEVLHKSRQQFHLRTFCVLGSNTTTDSYGNTRPIIGGFVVSVFSASTTAFIRSFASSWLHIHKKRRA